VLLLSDLSLLFATGNDPTATESLKELDDELQGVRDMVDTTPYQGKVTTEFLVKVSAARALVQLLVQG